MSAMRHGRRILWLFISLIVTAGCRNNDLVENELRARDIQYREAISELNRTEAFADSLRRENDAIRAGQGLPPEVASQVYTVRKIVLGRSTGGVDDDGVPG